MAECAYSKCTAEADCTVLFVGKHGRNEGNEVPYCIEHGERVAVRMNEEPTAVRATVRRVHIGGSA